MIGAAVRKLLRPLTRLLLRSGISYASFAEWAKGVFVDVASEEFALPGRKQSDSRISVLTGLTRKEVRRIRSLSAPEDPEAIRGYNRAARVMSGWLRDEEFLDDSGAPAVVSEQQFALLVARYSGDMPVRAVLDELERVGAVRHGEAGIEPLARGYVPSTDEHAKLGILGSDVALLIQTIDHNLHCEKGLARYQRKVAYNNLPEEAMEELRKLSGEHAQALLELLDRWMAARDRDANPDARGTGRKHAGVGVYYFEEDVGDGTPENRKRP
ncbi:MAG: hypothetical protein KDH88_15575 [Chromatiales bacterium]|nr:hypothetical protein [Chromatiales bacterium]